MRAASLPSHQLPTPNVNPAARTTNLEHNCHVVGSRAQRRRHQRPVLDKGDALVCHSELDLRACERVRACVCTEPWGLGSELVASRPPPYSLGLHNTDLPACSCVCTCTCVGHVMLMCTPFPEGQSRHLVSLVKAHQPPSARPPSSRPALSPAGSGRRRRVPRGSPAGSTAGRPFTLCASCDSRMLERIQVSADAPACMGGSKRASSGGTPALCRPELDATRKTLHDVHVVNPHCRSSATFA